MGARVIHRHGIIAAIALSCSSMAHAQDQLALPTTETTPPSVSTSNAEIESYTPNFFDAFQPVTALDMVERIPGFTLRAEDSERGFGEADTNFLINGRRPSTKNQSARDILSRIPANTVVLIEILDGETLDIPGLTGQVANIQVQSTELSGQWRYAARFEEGTEPQLLEGEVSLSGERGDLSFNIAVEAGQFLLTEDSIERFYDGTGNLIEDRTEDVFLHNTNPQASLNLSWTPETGQFARHVANLNMSIARGNDNNGIREVFTAIDPTRTSGTSFAHVGENELEIEIGADYAFPLNLGAIEGRLKLIGLTRNEQEDGETIFVLARDGQDATRTAFGEDVEEGETIIRGEYAFNLGRAHDLQLSAEYAFNFLESETVFENNFTTPVTDFVRVEEDRFDARLSDSWQFSPNLSAQLSVGAEYSSLQVVDPRSDSRNFFRPKGFAALSYKLSDRYTMRARAERSVGQLNFGTFVSDRNLSENLVTAGNTQIKPSQSWDLSVEFERTDDKLLSGRIRPYYERIEDPIDRVLINGQFEGPGNLDSATRYGVETNATLLFDTLGIPGLRVEASGSIGDSEIDDPLTGESRQINFNVEYAYNLFARYDIPETNYAIYGQVDNDESSPFFRLDDIRTVDVKKPFLQLGFIHKSFFGMQLEIRGTNLLDNTVIQKRERFQGPDLRLGPLTRVEQFERKRGPRLSIILSDTF